MHVVGLQQAHFMFVSLNFVSLLYENICLVKQHIYKEVSLFQTLQLERESSLFSLMNVIKNPAACLFISLKKS